MSRLSQGKSTLIHSIKLLKEMQDPKITLLKQSSNKKELLSNNKMRRKISLSYYKTVFSVTNKANKQTKLQVAEIKTKAMLQICKAKLKKLS